jgi:Sec-independent protein translocase protein TatA
MLSVPDVTVVAVLALLLFGPEHLPVVMRKVGRVMREVQNASQAFMDEMERAADLQEMRARSAPVEPAAESPPDEAPHSRATASPAAERSPLRD